MFFPIIHLEAPICSPYPPCLRGPCPFIHYPYIPEPLAWREGLGPWVFLLSLLGCFVDQSSLCCQAWHLTFWLGELQISEAGSASWPLLLFSPVWHFEISWTAAGQPWSWWDTKESKSLILQNIWGFCSALSQWTPHLLILSRYFYKPLSGESNF